MNPFRRGPLGAMLLTVALLQPPYASAQDADTRWVRELYLVPGEAGEDSPPGSTEEFGELSLERLMAIEVTSVAGVGHEWFKTPAAMGVVTGEDVRRSGHRSIAEALRMVPGVHVGQITSNQWAVSTRGFNSRFANKQLVLIDGRSVYDPLFGGVFWDVQDVLLEDLDRVEVIRGPGATLWGANAVNGVINVTTKSAKQTQGLYLSAGAGTYERGFGAVRYGAQIDDSSWFRVWGKYSDRDNFFAESGGSGHDEWDMARGGFRYDREGDDYTTLTLQGDIYNTDRLGESTRIAVPTGPFATLVSNQEGRAGGGNFLARVGQLTPEGEGWSLQGYYDRTERVGGNRFQVNRDTLDLDFRHFFHLGEAHEVIWGAGYRHSRDRTEANAIISFDPRDRSLDTFSAFVQDTITLHPDRLFFMAGTKLEHNDFTGFEYQPSARLWYTPDDRNTLWAAVSRPVRVPSRTEADLTLITAFAGPPGGPFAPLAILGDDSVDSEELLAYEAGYRVKVTEGLTLDTAVFFNDYRRLFALPPPGIGTFDNTTSGESYGVEAAATWRVADNWRLEASYSFLNVHADSTTVADPERSHPHHQAQVHSYLDITRDLELNAALYYVDNVPSQGAPWYLRLDVGVTWRPTDHLELAVWGQNLLDERHREFNDTVFLAEPTEVPRAAYIQATFRF